MRSARYRVVAQSTARGAVSMESALDLTKSEERRDFGALHSASS
ncbi:hypothetical protein BURMUCF2_A0332 [Burkholderia multivorans CF2]|nr:hypothetical protein BURMUCF2_A0332 [Burkholderia multivorans CF2]